MPYQDLLRVRTAGVQVSELSSFLERETGRIDLASVSHSWLIFSDGFASGRMWSAMIKRAFDITVSLLLLVIALPVILITAIAIRLESNGPAIYRQRRVGLYNQPFEIPKLRSMREDAELGGRRYGPKRTIHASRASAASSARCGSTNFPRFGPSCWVR